MTDCPLTDVQIERWRLLQEERQQDLEELNRQRKSDAQRRSARKEMLHLLARFLHQEIDLEAFRGTFDLRTRSEWDVFGFKGMSGAMFLNTLVKHLPSQDEVAAELRRILPVPEGPESGSRGLERFHSYLSGVIRNSQVTKRQVQPARVPFFVSGWWHLQDLEQWPVFYTSGRRALKQAGIYEATGDPVADYFRFRACFLNLASALDCTSWETEHLLAWKDERKSTVERAAPSTEAATSDEELVARPVETEELDHTYIQWLLARIGRSMDCRVWIAANDHNRTWQGQRLGDLSMEQLPSLGLDEESQRIIGYIDVIWMQGYKRVAAAFEVEHTTSVYSGLLRMADLVALSPNLNFPLYIVAPESRLNKVRRELSRPTFQTLGLHEQCGFFSFEELDGEAENIMRWANDPLAIEGLAKKVDSVAEERF